MPNIVSIGLGGGSLITRDKDGVCYYIVMIPYHVYEVIE